MYAPKEIRHQNDSEVTHEPKQLSAALVSAGTVIASRGEESLPRIGRETPDGFVAVGNPVKIQLHSDVADAPTAGFTLAQTREYLAERFAEDPNLYWGIANRGQDWGHLQAYRRL